MAVIKQIGERIETIAVYRDGDRVWEEPFPVIVYEDGETALSGTAMTAWEARNQHFLELARRGELPEPTAIRPVPVHPRGEPATVWTDSVLRPLVVHREGDRTWSENFMVTVDEDGKVLLSDATLALLEWEKKRYRELAEHGLLPEPDEAPAPDAHEAAGA